MSIHKVTVSTELEDGRVLECRYTYEYSPGFISGPPESCYPDETEVGDPEYYINGEPADYDLFTPEISQLADELYEADETTKKFKYRSVEDDSFFEPDDFGPEY